MQLAVPRCSCPRKFSSSFASANKVWWVCVIACKIMTTHIRYGAGVCRDSLPRKVKLAWLQTHNCRNWSHSVFSLPNQFISTCHLTFHVPSPCPPQDPSAFPQPTSQDLAGFWDLLQLNIEDVRVKFQDLQRLKDSNWRLPPEKKVRGPVVHTALVSLQHSPRAKMAVCRRVAQMVVPSKPLQAVKIQNGKRNRAELSSWDCGVLNC